MVEPSNLKDKRAVVFGAGGSIGAAVARTFAAEGADVFLAGRSRASLDAVAGAISDALRPGPGCSD
jgi:3-oxoacyl-[acyl-carrier protein] reductase